MLLKWIVLLVIAWYVSKAFGNIILMLRGASPDIPPNRSRRDGDGPGKVHNGNVHNGNVHSANAQSVHRKEPKRPSKTEKREIEDARFTDL